MGPCDALHLYCAGRRVISSRAVTCSLQQEAVSAVERLTSMRCITVLWRQWSRWAKPQFFWKAKSYDAVMRPLLDTISEKLDAGRKYGRVKHVVFASYAQLLARLALPNDAAAFKAVVETLILATGHGRKRRRRIGPTVHLAMEHFVTDHETYMGPEAVILLLRTIAAFEVAHRIRWTPILLKQVLQGGAPLHTLLKVRHQGHTGTLLLSCVSLAEHMPAEIGATVADVIGRVAMAEELWSGLIHNSMAPLCIIRQGDGTTLGRIQQSCLARMLRTTSALTCSQGIGGQVWPATCSFALCHQSLSRVWRTGYARLMLSRSACYITSTARSSLSTLVFYAREAQSCEGRSSQSMMRTVPMRPRGFASYSAETIS